MRYAAAALLAGGAAGHGSMTKPPSRNGGTLLKAGREALAGAAASWYTVRTKAVGKTLPAGFHTVDIDQQMFGPGVGSPWNAPGTAPVNSPCGQWGVPGAGPLGPHGSGGDSMDGKSLPPKQKDVWQRGGTAKVAFAIYQNHGGGYAYRLCPASEPLTEECFQRRHLQFADNETT
eukprot:gene6752-400_t